MASTLTAQDTCDAGENAAAQSLWELATFAGEGQRTMQFCGHHTREFGPALLAQGFTIVDASAVAKSDAVSSASVSA